MGCARSAIQLRRTVIFLLAVIVRAAYSVQLAVLVVCSATNLSSRSTGFTDNDSCIHDAITVYNQNSGSALKSVFKFIFLSSRYCSMR